MTSEKKNFERELPEGYRLAKHLDAREARFGIIFNLIAMGVMLTVVGLSLIPLYVSRNGACVFCGLVNNMTPILVIVGMVLYTVLHELVHGIAYKARTGEKLTFGLSWSCAFCGVPKIYTYRRTALIAVLAPFVVFSLLLGALTVALFFISVPLYFVSVLVLGLHLGGCAGDLYVTILLLFKFKDKGTLMRDTGPEQFFYVPE